MPDPPSPARTLLPGGRAVVTGDGRLARALAEGLAGGGASVRVVGRGEGAVPCDFGSRGAVGAAMNESAEALGGLDLVVHAWVHPEALEPAPVVDMPEDRWARACESTLDAALWVAQESHCHLRAGGPPGRAGTLVFVVTTIAMAGGAGFAPLATAAEGVRTLAKSSARVWGPDGVAVHAVALGPELVIGGESGAALARDVSLAVPALGRPGDPATDVAPLVALLATPEARFATGTTIVLDGGVWTAL